MSVETLGAHYKQFHKSFKQMFFNLAFRHCVNVFYTILHYLVIPIKWKLKQIDISGKQMLKYYYYNS